MPSTSKPIRRSARDGFLKVFQSCEHEKSKKGAIISSNSSVERAANFIRLNQANCVRRSIFIYAIRTERDAANVGRLTILPAMYGRPDLFTISTYNPIWIEIVQLLLPGQTSIDRHDITARVFKQKIL